MQNAFVAKLSAYESQISWSLDHNRIVFTTLAGADIWPYSNRTVHIYFDQLFKACYSGMNPFALNDMFIIKGKMLLKHTS
jgi:hypothetical protein